MTEVRTGVSANCGKTSRNACEGERNIILRCENSAEGIFSAVYEGFLIAGRENLPRNSIHLAFVGEGQELLFSEERFVATKPDQAGKVARSIYRDFGEEAYVLMMEAIAAPEEEKADAIYHCLVTGYELPVRSRRWLFHNQGDPYVRQCFSYAKRAGNEAHHYKGFLRFAETDLGILLARITPKSDVLPLLMPHFADRFPSENFVIYDETHHKFGIHPNQKEWFLMSEEAAGVTGQGPSGPRTDLTERFGRKTEREEEYEALFREFVHTIAIEGRKNLKLQRQLLPLWLRGNMTEF